MGITESALAPALLRMYPGEQVLIDGPKPSGRNGLLRAIASLPTTTAVTEAGGRQVVLIGDADMVGDPAETTVKLVKDA